MAAAKKKGAGVPSGARGSGVKGAPKEMNRLVASLTPFSEKNVVGRCSTLL